VNDEKKNSESLADRQHWIERWSDSPAGTLVFDPFSRNFRDLHRFFKKNLPHRKGLRFLELGCYPGRYPWYFDKFFGYRVSGMEYIESCCEQTRKLLDSCGVRGEIIHADIFDFQPGAGHPLWDVVASFGLIEHYKDLRAVVARHVDFLKAGGYLLLVVPNHQGIYGKILRKVSPELHRIHRILSREEIVQAVEADSRTEILEAGYYGLPGLGHTGIRERLKQANPYLRFLGRIIIFTIENLGRLLPRSPALSPFIAVVARKK